MNIFIYVGMILSIILTYVFYRNKMSQGMFVLRYITLILMILLCKVLHSTITQQQVNYDLCNEFILIDK